MREVVAEMRNPVMLYSIGKDSSVMLHVAMKAFHPAKPPFPLLHVDTTWKFREMIAFRDETARRLGLELIVHVNEDGVRRGHFADRLGLAGPHPGDEDGSASPGARRRAATTRRSAARGATRRRAAPRSASSRTARPRTPGTRAISARSSGGCSTRASATASRCGSFPLSNWTELDVWEYIRAENIPVVPLYFAKVPAGGRALGRAHHGRRRPPAARAGREAADDARALPHARLLSADRRDRIRRRDARRHHRRNARRDASPSGRGV